MRVGAGKEPEEQREEGGVTTGAERRLGLSLSGEGDLAIGAVRSPPRALFVSYCGRLPDKTP